MEQAPTAFGAEYRHHSRTVPVVPSTHSILPQDVTPTSPRDYFPSLKNPFKTPAQPMKIGVLLSSDSSLHVFPKCIHGVEFPYFALGSVSDPLTTAQRFLAVVWRFSYA